MNASACIRIVDIEGKVAKTKGDILKIGRQQSMSTKPSSSKTVQKP